MIDELSHKREDLGIIGRGRKNQFTVAESIFHCFCHIIPGQVEQRDFGAVIFFQLVSQKFNCLFRISVYRGVGDHYAFILRSIGRPCVVQVQIIAKVFGENRSVKRTDRLDIQTGSGFQQFLRLCSVLPYDSEIVSSGFAGPVFFHIICTEFTETVS